MPIGFGRSILTKTADAPAVEIPSRTPLTITADGDAQVDTAIKQFGSGSALFDGTDDWLETTETQVIPATGDYTVEGWVYLNSTTEARQTFVAQYDAGTSGRWEFGTFGNDGLILFINGSTNVLLYGPNTASMDVNISTGVWKHWATTRDGDVFSVFYDGDRIGQQTVSGITVQDRYLVVGSRGELSDANSPVFNLDGHMDEVRVSSSVRYTGTTYTVPTAAFNNDNDTILLIHADGTDGSTTFTDDGGPQ